MITQQTAQDLILAGRFQRATLVNANRVLEAAGACPVGEHKINQLKNNIKALTYCVYNLNDLTSATFLSVYNCLSNIVGLHGSPVVDPHYQNPNYVINVTQTGSQAVNYTYTQADLLDAGGGNWYLPYNLDATTIPLLLTINNVSTPFTFDESVIPSRVYGFANNLSQTIVLTVISTT